MLVTRAGCWAAKPLLATAMGLMIIVVVGGVPLPRPTIAARSTPSEIFSAQAAFAAAEKSGGTAEILSQKSATTRAWERPLSGSEIVQLFTNGH